ncbi:MAG: 4-hydroxybenzoyl-CoA reductase subunit beta [Xanthobacteraceae bacterium]
MSELAPFQVARPRDVEAAIALCSENAQSRYIAGGTDLMVNIRRGIRQPELLIDLSGVDVLNEFEITGAGARIGAGVTLARLAADPGVRERYRAVAEAAEAIAGPGHRSMATVGGNLCLDTRCIYYNQSEWWRHANQYCLKNRGDTCHVAPQGKRCHAAFSGDLAPALMVLGAEIEILGPAGRRRIPLGDLYAEDGRAHLKLAPGELVICVRLPAAPPPSAYAKVRLRGSIDFPLAGVAVGLAMAGKTVSEFRVGLTGTNSRPFLLEGTGDFLGRPLDEEALARLDKLVQKQVQPMRTTLASANYRRLAAAALARRLAARLAGLQGKT